MGFKTSATRSNAEPPRRKVIERIKKFISIVPRGDGNGLALVTQDELDELYDIIRDLASLRWRADADGDLPIRPPELIDWKRFEAAHWVPVPQTHFGEATVELEFERLSAILNNLATATAAVEREIRLRNLTSLTLAELHARSTVEKPQDPVMLRARLVAIESELLSTKQDLAQEKERTNNLVKMNREIRKKLPKEKKSC